MVIKVKQELIGQKKDRILGKVILDLAHFVEQSYSVKEWPLIKASAGSSIGLEIFIDKDIDSTT